MRHASRFGHPVALLGQAALLLVICVAPWFFGGVLPEHQVWIFFGVWVATICTGSSIFADRESAARLPVALLPLGFAVALVIAQLIPIPASLLRQVSPNAAHLWSEVQAAQSDPLPVSAESPTVTPRLSLYPAGTHRDLMLLLLASATFLSASCLFSSDDAPLRVIVPLAAIGVGLAFVGIAQQLTWSGKLFGKVVLEHGGTPFASFINKNNAGGFLNLCFAAAVALSTWSFARAESRESTSTPLGVFAPVVRWFADLTAGRLFAFISLVMIIAGLLACLSRSAWLATLFGGVVLCAGTYRKSQAHRGFILLGLVLAAAATMTVWLDRSVSVGQQLETFRNGQALSDARLVHWRDGLRAFADYPLAGSGLGTYRYIYRPYERAANDVWFYHAENQYLEAAVETGAVGLCLALLLILSIGTASATLLKSPVGSLDHACGVLGAVALVGQAVHAGFDFALHQPANLVAMAAIGGTVAGRSAWRRPRDARVGWRAFLISTRFHRPVTATLATVLAVALVWATMFTQARATARRVLRDTELPTERNKPELTDVARSIACLSAHKPTHDDDSKQLLKAWTQRATNLGSAPMYSLTMQQNAEVQMRLAELWLYRYRLGAFELAANHGSDAAALWNASSPVELHGQVQTLIREERDAELFDLHRSSPLRSNLTRAVSHLRWAQAASPLVPRAHVLLAALEPAVSAAPAETRNLELAFSLAGTNTAIVTDCARMHWQAGRIGVALSSWQRCAELDARFIEKFIEVARRHAEFADRIDEVVPNDVDQLLAAATRLEEREPFRRPRSRLLDRAEERVLASEIPEAERHYLLGRILHLRGNLSAAIEQMTRATKLNPIEPEWRYRMALALHQAGRSDDARQELKLCVRLAGNEPRYEELLREVIRAEIENATK